MPKPKKKPTVKIRIIQPEGPQPKGDPYRVVAALVRQPDHEHLSRARIALAWHHGWTADPDGLIKLGKARKVGEADRQLHGFDFVILLNKRVWDRLDFADSQIEALLDHELMHCDAQRDDDGLVKDDERGRPIWRIRKHDIEEFSVIVARHGCWKRDIEAFVKTA
ncbi:MAG: hypothetical protein IMZ66_08425, partial [Planctomycetes bacterium]|nr:hypothetical protein [Planctomycetota bacterium]